MFDLFLHCMRISARSSWANLQQLKHGLVPRAQLMHDSLKWEWEWEILSSAHHRLTDTQLTVLASGVLTLLKTTSVTCIFLWCFIHVFVNMDISEHVQSVDPIWSVGISTLIYLLEVKGAAETLLQVSVHTDESIHSYSFFLFSYKILKYLNILGLETLGILE